jgi:hypothetical protein
MKKETSKRLTREQLAELKSLGALPDNAIDEPDAPELLDWSGAKPWGLLSTRQTATDTSARRRCRLLVHEPHEIQ